MRKPAHALNGATPLEALVFAKGKRKALFKVEGTDPSKMAKAVAEHPRITEEERKNVRPKVRDALQSLLDRAIPNVTDMQQDIGGRRIRVRVTA